MGERVNCNDIQDYIRTVQSVREQSLIEEGQRRNLLGLPSPFKGKQKQEGEITIAFPIANTDFETDGISHLLCQFMGGQMDIDIVRALYYLLY